ncbi:MAG: hypothetical protein ACNS60_04025 [Candidatus Cyclobacteriaceae bacterium M2_1C_046]
MEVALKIGLRVLLILFLVRCYPETNYMAEKPSSELTPRDVVNAQLKALKYNDQPYENAGMEIAYRFASPYHKAENGPFGRYCDMFSSQRYSTLINCQSYFIEKHFANEKKAEYFVFITDARGEEWVFLFRLSKQSASPYENLWMTDTVIAYADARALTGNYYIV